MNRRAVVIAVSAVLTGTAAVSAHHSIAGMYDGTRQATVDGVVTRFDFVNPHPFVWVEVRSGTAVEAWQLELDNRRELTEIGFSADTLRPGDRIVAAGSPARRETHRMYVRRLDRPVDGFGYEQVGTRPRLRTPPR